MSRAQTSELIIISDHLWGRRLLEIPFSLVGGNPNSKSLKKQTKAKQNNPPKKPIKKKGGGRMTTTWRTEILQTVWVRENFKLEIVV